MKSSLGQGTIEKLPSGNYRFRVTINGKRKWSPICKTYEEAVAMQQASLHLLKKKKTIQILPTLRIWGEKWLLTRNNENASSDRCNWKNHIETSLFIDKPLNQINRTDIKYWLLELQKKSALIPGPKGIFIPANRTISSSTQSNAFNLLRKSFQDAWDEGLITINPAERLKIDSDPDLDDDWTHLTKEEIQSILDCKNIPIEKKLIYQFAIYTGLRQGEIWGLRWEDVHKNGEHFYLSVRKSFEGKTKNKRSRKVPLFEQALQALLTWKNLCPQSKTIIFCKPDGTMYGRGYDAGWADRIVNGKTKIGHKTMAGVFRAVKFHDLRHTCASHLIMGTWGECWNIYEVRDILGHQDISTTQRYAHLSPEHLQKKAQRTALVSGPCLVHELKPPTGIEPVTYGLRTNPISLKNKDLQNTPMDHAVHNFVHGPKKLAQEILNLQKLQRPIPIELITSLAQFVLSQNPETDSYTYLPHLTKRAQA